MTFFVVLRLLVALVTCWSSAAADNPRPHILIVIVDDAGVQDVGFSSELFGGGSPVRTPRLDQLAREGIRLPNYYTHPTCTPSRVALMTGKYAFMAGVPLAIVGRGPAIGLDPSLPTIANALQDRGYMTHMVGKWHLGHAKEIYSPPRRGFQTFFGNNGGGFDHYTKMIPDCLDLWRFNKTEGEEIRQYRKEEVDVTQHATELYSQEAVKIIVCS